MTFTRTERRGHGAKYVTDWRGRSWIPRADPVSTPLGSRRAGQLGSQLVGRQLRVQLQSGLHLPAVRRSLLRTRAELGIENLPFARPFASNLPTFARFW